MSSSCREGVDESWRKGLVEERKCSARFEILKMASTMKVEDSISSNSTDKDSRLRMAINFEFIEDPCFFFLSFFRQG